MFRTQERDDPVTGDGDGDDGGDGDVVRGRFPPHDQQFSSATEAAQKRLASQLVSQMPSDPREQRQILKYMNELVSWHEGKGDDGPSSAD